LYRRRGGEVEVLLGHPGGPYWSRKDDGVWTIPKGELDDTEEPVEAARREFEEETGIRLQGQLVALGEVKQAGGKVVRAWTLEYDCDPAQLRSNSFSMEWPPRSGKLQDFPEIDRFGWFELQNARVKLLKAQAAFLDRLAALVAHHLHA
jgi:predicted NUDIX family NTP pyrophosphohydrolase